MLKSHKKNRRRQIKRMWTLVCFMIKAIQIFRGQVCSCVSWSHFTASIIHMHNKCGFVGLAQEDDITAVDSADRAAVAIVKDVGSVSKSSVTRLRVHTDRQTRVTTVGLRVINNILIVSFILKTTKTKRAELISLDVCWSDWWLGFRERMFWLRLKTEGCIMSVSYLQSIELQKLCVCVCACVCVLAYLCVCVWTVSQEQQT